jgi:hypothetical protein
MTAIDSIQTRNLIEKSEPNNGESTVFTRTPKTILPNTGMKTKEEILASARRIALHEKEILAAAKK